MQIQSPVPVGALSCQKDSYLKSLDTEVVSCTEFSPPTQTKIPAKGKPKKVNGSAEFQAEPAQAWLIEFADSVFFPEGGGQPTDHGSVIPSANDGSSSTISITNVQRRGLRCVVLSPQPLTPGSRVRQDVDFTRRWGHMQQHTGQHLLSCIMDSMNLETLGWGMGTAGEMNYVELPRKPTSEEIRTIQDKCNAAIRANLPITVETPGDAKADSLPSDYDKEKGVVRFIKIGNLDYNACCGTHLKQTSHIGLILLHHTQPIRSTNCRLFFSAGNRAINLATTSIEAIRSMALSMSSGTAPSDVQSSVQRLSETVTEVRKSERRLLSEIAKYEGDRIKADLIAGRNAWCYRATDGLDFINLVTLEVRDAVKERGTVIMVSGEEKKAGMVMIIGQKDVVETLATKTKELVSSIKGGGRGEKWQGKVVEWKKGEIEAFHQLVTS
ncbi:ThrRS/AlaRS common domain-containing protein [Lophiostoma macrostomum CBS 122681]|uniref:ThrRS/AlaRS common domain-containing protein n=1 Tax=Lophiostoma macrostomum CBS 122681 TaxID=1314788 RepID=A0A6A6TJ96_9PLEO|nr:ThrRS/AlaRS common domain-containing protein [Lophiostoma macrostomum CBS 122681]